jgi:Cys-rich four helix bundle protein (predicted Tat secretion target)
MERRHILAWVGGVTAAGGASAMAGSRDTMLVAQADTHVHDHAAMSAAPAAPRKYDGLVVPYQACTRAAQSCIAHCQELLAQGDKSLGECLRTALDTEAVCSTVLKLASFNSKFAASLAKESIAVMQACVNACKEHVNHHAACKACHDACLKAIQAAKLVS